MVRIETTLKRDINKGVRTEKVRRSGKDIFKEEIRIREESRERQVVKCIMLAGKGCGRSEKSIARPKKRAVIGRDR